jgi:hypothetical protein
VIEKHHSYFLCREQVVGHKSSSKGPGGLDPSGGVEENQKSFPLGISLL